MEASRAVTEPRSRTSLRRQLALFKRPSDRAFEQLYNQHAREVYQYALALLANPADAEDVTQTTFLNAYRAFQKGERPHKPHNWLIAITHNVCRMRWRQAGSRPREVALEDAPEPATRDDDQPNLDEVLTALAALSFNQRAAIVMRELEGRSYQEISGVLGVSVSAVEALLFRARRNLQIRRRALGVLSDRSAARLARLLHRRRGRGGRRGQRRRGRRPVAEGRGSRRRRHGHRRRRLRGRQGGERAASSEAGRARSVEARGRAAAGVHAESRAPAAPGDRGADAAPKLRRAAVASHNSAVSRPSAPSGSAPAPQGQAAAPPPPPPAVTPPAPPQLPVQVPPLPPPPVTLPPLPPLP